MYNGYKTGTFLKVAQGQILDLTIYNAKSSGSLSYKFIYSGAQVLVTTVIGVGLVAMSVAL